jgi:hypothetical protein
MRAQRQIIEYESQRPRRGGAARELLSSVVSVNLWGIAILAPIFTVVGTLSFWFQINDMYMFGEPVVTALQKLVWIGRNALLSGLSISLLVWRIRSKSRRNPCGSNGES